MMGRSEVPRWVYLDRLSTEQEYVTGKPRRASAHDAPGRAPRLRGPGTITADHFRLDIAQTLAICRSSRFDIAQLHAICRSSPFNGRGYAAAYVLTGLEAPVVFK